jgi:RNA polymerase sigma factor (sigma-70 family)
VTTISGGLAELLEGNPRLETPAKLLSRNSSARCSTYEKPHMSGRAKALATPAQGTYEGTVKRAVSFDEAFTLHHRAVFRTARAYVRDNGIAEDVTQEVFLRLYKNLESVPSDELLRAWLLRVTINVSLNTIRGQSRSTAREDEYFKAATWEVNGPPEPEEELERKLLIEQTRKALDKIKEPMRSCLILKQQGLSYKEIAETLSLNETSIGTYVARGRKEFLRVYGKTGGHQ